MGPLERLFYWVAARVGHPTGYCTGCFLRYSLRNWQAGDRCGECGELVVPLRVGR